MEIQNLLVFHVKTGGDLEGKHFHTRDDGGAFFATSAAAATTYAEHSFMVDYMADRSMCDNDDDLLRAAPVLFPVRLTLQNPAILDQAFLHEVRTAVGIEPGDLQRFVEDFEDSMTAERKQVFQWLREQGYDGAYLPRDSMPEAPCGDLCLRECFVAFKPETQVVFALSAIGDAACQWSAARDQAEMNKALSYSDAEQESCEVPAPRACAGPGL